MKSLHLQVQFTHFSKATVLALSFPPIKTSPFDAYVSIVGISSLCEVSEGGTLGLKQLLNFEIISGGRQAPPPISTPNHGGLSMLLWGEAKKEIQTIIK